MYNPYKLKKVVLAVVATLFFIAPAKAQLPACSTYVFTTSSAAFTYLSGATSAATIHCDDCILTNVPLGFTFPFCGNNYSIVSVGSNGYISLNNSSNVYLSGSTSYFSALGPTFFPMWGDEWGTTGANASYQTSGTAPNRVFTFEWRNWRPYSYTSNAEYSMQVKLYETSGRIQFHYTREGSNPRTNVAIGIGYSAADYQSLPNMGTSPVPSNTTFTTSINSWFTSGQIYQWDPPTPCTKASALTMGNFNSQAASFSWTGVTGALDYQYAVDTRADLSPAVGTPITSTPLTNGNKTGLTPATRYYLHVRTRCTLTSISQWDTVSFVTLPECTKPAKIIIAYIDSNSVQFQWPGIVTATTYQYIVTGTKLTPTAGIATSTTNTFVAQTGLNEGSVYYVYYRSLCPNADSSGWMLDSFRTPVPCRAPSLSLSTLKNNNAVASWSAVNTAFRYEYYLGTVATAPSIGTPILTTNLQMPYLTPSTTYDLFVRCNCNDYGIKTNSKWSLLEFATLPPTGIANVGEPTVSLNVYPNPVKDLLNVDLAGVYSKNAELRITDIAGRVLQIVPVSGTHIVLDTKGLASGTYILDYADGQYNQKIRFNKL